MTQATSSAGTSFAVEKAVVAVAAILTAAFTLIHLTGVILASQAWHRAHPSSAPHVNSLSAAGWSILVSRSPV